MLFKLAKEFSISQEEMQDMSGNQFSLVNRIMWSDEVDVVCRFRQDGTRANA